MVKRQIRIKIRDTWHTVEVDDPVSYPFSVTVDGETIEVEIETPLMPGQTASRRHTAAPPPNVGLTGISQQNERIIRSPMPGRIVSVSVTVWDEISPGGEVCILETMKMEQSILLSRSGIVRAVFVQAGQNVNAGDPLIQLE